MIIFNAVGIAGVPWIQSAHASLSVSALLASKYISIEILHQAAYLDTTKTMILTGKSTVEELWIDLSRARTYSLRFHNIYNIVNVVRSRYMVFRESELDSRRATVTRASEGAWTRS
jgi:hypothetical protein